MTVIKVESTITEWEQSIDKIKGKINESDEPLFKLTNHHPEHKSLMQIDDAINIRNSNDELVFKIAIVSIIQFDIIALRPTLQELYECYLNIKDSEDEAIWERLVKNNVAIARPMDRRSFNNIETKLEELIQITYNEN